MGRNAEEAREKLNKVLKDDLTFDELIKTGIKILREATEEEIEDETIQVGCVNAEDGQFRILSPEDTKPYLAWAYLTFPKHIFTLFIIFSFHQYFLLPQVLLFQFLVEVVN